MKLETARFEVVTRAAHNGCISCDPDVSCCVHGLALIELAAAAVTKPRMRGANVLDLRVDGHTGVATLGDCEVQSNNYSSNAEVGVRLPGNREGPQGCCAVACGRERRRISGGWPQNGSTRPGCR